MIRAILILGLVILACNVAWIFGSPLMKNTMLQAKMEDLSKYRGLKSQGQLELEMQDYLDEKGIPLPMDNLYLHVNDRETLIAGYYEVDADFWVLHHRYEFSPASSPAALRELDIRMARRRINAR
jgi:hypothetical protein